MNLGENLVCLGPLTEGVVGNDFGKALELTEVSEIEDKAVSGRARNRSVEDAYEGV